MTAGECVGEAGNRKWGMHLGWLKDETGEVCIPSSREMRSFLDKGTGFRVDVLQAFEAKSIAFSVKSGF